MAPPELPAFGTFRGQPIDLARVAELLTPEERPEVFVDVPGVGRVRPWRFVTDGSEVQVDEDGTLVI